MMMSQREKYIAIGVLAAVGLYLIDLTVLEPYYKRRTALNAARDEATRQINYVVDTRARQRKLEPVWTEMQRGGLRVDPSQAETQSQLAILEWARGANLEIASIRPERQTKEGGKFQVISFSVTGTGPMAAVSRFLWSLETATIPVRVSDMQITPRREGQDDLSIRLSVSALCLPPDADKPSVGNGTNANSSGSGAATADKAGAR